MKPVTTHSLSIVYALLLAGLTLALTLPAVTAHAGDETSTTQETAPVALNPIVQIEGDQILLGHVFTPLDRYADRVIARAPAPGEEMVLPAVWLWKVAKTFGVDWQPTSTADVVTVSRPSSVIDQDQIEGLLTQSYFARTGEDDLIELEMDGGPSRIDLPRTVAPTARIDRFDLDTRSGRFTATLIAPATGRPLERMNVSGRFHRMVEMPVPARRLGVGAIIEQSDITMMRVREDGLGTNLIVDPQRLVGQAVRRSLSAGKPVRIGDVNAPRLVEKGRVIIVTLRTESLALTVNARAMESGAKGDIIRVQNTQSKTVIDAVVTGEGRASVNLPQPLAANIH